MARIQRWPFRLLALELGFLLFVGCAGQGSEPRNAASTETQVSSVSSGGPASEREPAKRQKLFFWRTKSEISTVYLLGSVHVASRDMYPLDPQIEQAFRDSQTLALEVVMDDGAQLEAAQKLAQAASYPQGDTLQNHISAETFAKLEVKLQKAGLPVSALIHFRPWFVAITLSMAELARLDFDPELGIDEHFRRQADAKKRLLSIETVADQISLFTSMSAEAQEDELKQTLDELDALGSEMSAAIEVWNSGDTSGLDKLLLEPVRRGYPELFRKLFLERNVKMAGTVEQLLREPGTHFVIVGSGHLVGEQGVLDLLKRHGHGAEQFERTPSASSAAVKTAR